MSVETQHFDEQMFTTSAVLMSWVSNKYNAITVTVKILKQGGQNGKG